jgi:hypothetical protein
MNDNNVGQDDDDDDADDEPTTKTPTPPTTKSSTPTTTTTTTTTTTITTTTTTASTTTTAASAPRRGRGRGEDGEGPEDARSTEAAKGKCARTMQLFVRSTHGKVVVLDFDEDSSVASLQAQIQLRMCVPPRNQRLTHTGTTLEPCPPGTCHRPATRARSDGVPPRGIVADTELRRPTLGPRPPPVYPQSREAWPHASAPTPRDEGDEEIRVAR